MRVVVVVVALSACVASAYASTQVSSSFCSRFSASALSKIVGTKVTGPVPTVAKSKRLVLCSFGQGNSYLKSFEIDEQLGVAGSLKAAEQVVVQQNKRYGVKVATVSGLSAPAFSWTLTVAGVKETGVDALVGTTGIAADGPLLTLSSATAIVKLALKTT